MATTTVPETAPVPDGRIGWRRKILIGLGGVAALVAASHGLGIPLGYVAAGAGALGGGLHVARKYPEWKRHWNPLGRPPDRHYRQRQAGHSAAWQANWKRGSAFSGAKSRSPLSRHRGGHRGMLSRAGSGRHGRRSLRSLVPGAGRRPRPRATMLPVSRRRGGAGLRRPFRSLSGRRQGSRNGFRRPGTGSRSRTGRPGSFRRGSGAFRRSRGTSGGSRRPGGAFRRPGGAFRRSPGRRAGTGSRPRAGSRGGSRPRAGSRGGSRFRPFRRRTGSGARPGGASRPGARTKTGRWRPWKRRAGTGSRPGGRAPRPKAGHLPRWRRLARAGRKAPGGTRRPSSPPSRPPEASPPPRRRVRAWLGRSRAGRAARRVSRSRPGRGVAWGFRRAARSRPGRSLGRIAGRARRAAARRSPPAAFRRRRAAAPARRAARQAHAARKRQWRAKLNRIYPKRRHWWTPWRPRFTPFWRNRSRRLGWTARRKRAWNSKRIHPGLGRPLRRTLRTRLRGLARRLHPRRVRARFRRWRRHRARPPQQWAQRGTRWRRQVARTDQWRRARWMRRMFPRRRRPPLAPPAAAGSASGHGRRTPPLAPPASVPGQGNDHPTGENPMANSQQVADGIRDLSIEFDDAEELHQVLMHLHEIIEATQERLQQLGERVSETALKAEYSDAISEAAGSLSGTADHLQSVVGGGVLQG